MKLKKSEIRKILSNIYQEACLQDDCDMREVVDLFEGLTETFLQYPTLLVWNKIKLHTQRFDKSPYLELLLNFRNHILLDYTEKSLALIHQELALGKKNAFKIWFEIYTDALITLELDVLLSLGKSSFEFLQVDQKKVVSYKELNFLISDNKWSEAIDFFIALSSAKTLPPSKRSVFAIYTAQIFLYHFGYGDKAMDWHQKAKDLDPENVLCERFLGEHYLVNKKLVSARNHFLNAISMECNHVEAYVFMGDSFMEEQKFEKAKQWYHDAIGINFLDLIPYSRLILLFGEAKWISENYEEFQSLISKVRLIENRSRESNDLYNAYRDIAFAYSKNNYLEQAKEYYENAIALRPQLTSAKVDLAYIMANNKKFDDAEKMFSEVIKMAYPGHFFEGYWGMGWLHEQKEELEIAISYYLKCIGLRSYGDDRVYNVLGIQHYNLKNYEKAIENYQKAIQAYPRHTIYYDNLKRAIEESGDSTKLQEYYDRLIESFPQNPFHLNDAGVFYHEQKDYQKAIELYSRAITLEQNNQIYFKNRALAYQILHKYTESKKDYLAAFELAKDPKWLGTLNLSEKDYLKALELGQDSNLLNSLGLINFYQEQHEEAISYYSKAIELDSEKAVYWENRAIAQEKLGAFDEAVKDYQKVLEFGDDSFTYNAIGRIRYWQKEYLSAVEYYTKAIELAPSVSVYWENRGLVRRDLQDYDSAEQDYLEALKLGESDNIYNAVGIISSIKGENEKAIDYFSRAIAINPLQAILYENRGIAYEKMGDLDKAEPEFIKAINLEVNDYRFNYLGFIYYRKGDHQKAVEYYNKAIELNPNNPIYWNNRALSYQNLQDYKNAEKDYLKALEFGPNFNITNSLGVIYYLLGNHPVAIEHYTKAIEMDPSQAILWENRALSWEKIQNYEKAEADGEKALELEETPIRYYFLGLVNFKQGKYEEAISYYSKAIEMDSENAIFWEKRALAYESLKYYKEAIDDYHHELSFGDDPFIFNRLGEIKLDQGQFEEARFNFQRAVDLDPDNHTFQKNLNITQNPNISL